MLNKSEFNIQIISNITLRPFFEMYLKDYFARSGLIINTDFTNYNEYFCDEHFDVFVQVHQIIVWINIDDIYPNLANDIISNKIGIETISQEIKNKFIEFYKSIKQKSKAPILWIGTEDYCYYYQTYYNGHALMYKGLFDNINLELNALLYNESDRYIDLKGIISRIGIENSFDNKSKYRWNTPYSNELLNLIAYEVYKQHLISYGITKKCLVLDCDNVLWGGILSEDGFERIQLGSAGLGRSYQDFQRLIVNLYYSGVIIAICSKNDKADVLRMFREHDEMILKEEHISCFYVNWNNKPDNIKRISEILNIGLDSIVFIDDSDFELQSVKELLPEVTAIKYNRDNIYSQLSCFNLKSDMNIDKIEQRTFTYKTNEQREILKSEAISFDDYLNALEMRVDIHKALSIELSRIAELTQRTNKCTNGMRYTVNMLNKKIENGYELYSVSLSDKFSDLGLVGVIGIYNDTLDLFSLSCRALGRNVEELMIDFINQKHIKRINYEITPKNHELYQKLNGIIAQ